MGKPASHKSGQGRRRDKNNGSEEEQGDIHRILSRLRDLTKTINKNHSELKTLVEDTAEEVRTDSADFWPHYTHRTGGKESERYYEWQDICKPIMEIPAQ